MLFGLSIQLKRPSWALGTQNNKGYGPYGQFALNFTVNYINFPKSCPCQKPVTEF